MKNNVHNFYKTWVMSAAILLILGISGSALANTTYRFRSISSPNDPTFTQLLGINNDRIIAGYFGSGADQEHPNKGFTLTLPNSFVDENFPSSLQTQVVGINNRGETGGFYVDMAGTTHGFLSVDGVFQNIDAPNTAFNQILGLNDLGQAVGYSSTDPAGAIGQRAFILNANREFVYINFPNGTGNSQATGINDSRDISGFYVTNTGVTYGFLQRDRHFARLSFPRSTATQALGLNNIGQVVGFYTDTAGNNHGFVFFNGHYHSVDEPNGIGTTIINGINDRGQIVGFYVNALGNTVGFVGKPGHSRSSQESE
jgi:probable HAF family extracellular repeat protein